MANMASNVPFRMHKGLVPPQSGHIDVKVLAANVAETYTIPDDCRVIAFSADNDFYVDPSGTAAVPSGDVTDGSAAALNPVIRWVAAGGSISLISPVACIVTLECYGEPEK